MERGVVAGVKANLSPFFGHPEGVLSPSSPDVLVLRRPASASWVLREAKQVAPTTRLAGREPSKALRSARVPLGATPAFQSHGHE